ncbi:hypothetical protein BG003_000793 [Podila horticola]|nr:hypothetical protein BG003_000793 [Podila horticola]
MDPSQSSKKWRPPSRSRMAGTLFFSVPGLDEDHVGGAGRYDLSDDDEPLHNSEDAIPLHQSYLPNYSTDNDDDDHDDHDDTTSESSSRSPPMSLFLDRQLQPEAPLTPAAIYLDVPPPVSGKSRGSRSLGEQLLAPRQISGPMGRTSISYKRQYKDPFFAGLLTYLSFLPLGVGSVFLGVIYFRRRYISRTTAIIELASDVLKENPDMFVVSFGLAVVHIVFTAIWLVLFARVFLIGHVESTDVWILEGNFYPIAAYFIFIFMWTSAVLSNVQRVTLANVVSKWYFHRHEPVAYQSSMNTMPALMNALTGSFGSVCLGSLFIAIVQFAVVLLRSTARVHLLTKLILFVNSLLLSLLTGFSAYVFATHTLQSPYGYIIGILSTIIPFYITRFFTHIMAITVDTTFLCYAIDLDTNTCHSNKAHSAFGTAYE